jgi:hypothetical protein
MHWRNSHFQIRYFLAGRCHTPDEAYRVLCELREERALALENADVSSLKLALRMRWLRWFTWLPVLGALASIERVRLCRELVRIREPVRVAREELAAIETMIAEVQPHRRYAHLPDREAHQAAQRDEWGYELAARAENYLLTGSLPPDQLATMRQHPDFASQILPRIRFVEQALSAPPGERDKRLAELLGQRPPLARLGLLDLDAAEH